MCTPFFPITLPSRASSNDISMTLVSTGLATTVSDGVKRSVLPIQQLVYESDQIN